MKPIIALSIITHGALLLGCSSGREPSPGPSTEGSVEIFSWWKSPGEAEALQALIDVFSEAEPAVEVINAASDDPLASRETLRAFLQSGRPPDSFQAISGVDIMNWVDAGSMQPISELALGNGWESVFPTELTEILSRDGELYAVPINIERDNNLYYNVALLRELDIAPPRTLPAFYSACERLQEQGVVPLAVPAAGWGVALIAFETLLPAVSGGQFYLDFLRGRAEPRGPELRALFEELAKVLRCSNVGVASSEWGAEGDTVYRGEAAMFVMGDWAKGYFEGGKDANGQQRRPWLAGTDFDVVPGLGSDGYYTFNSAVFGLPKGALHPEAAAAFLTTVGSLAGQQAFNPVKGSVPARTDVDLASFDEMVRGSAADFARAAKAEAKLLPGYASLTPLDFQVEINPSLLVFAVGGERARSLDPKSVPEAEAIVPPLDVDYLVAKVAANYPLLLR